MAAKLQAAFILILNGDMTPIDLYNHLWVDSLLQWGVEILLAAQHPLGLSSVWFCYGYSPDGDEPLASQVTLGFSVAILAPCSHCNLAKSGWMDVQKTEVVVGELCQSHSGLRHLFLDSILWSVKTAWKLEYPFSWDSDHILDKMS